VPLGGAHGELELHSVCLQSADQAVVMSKVGAQGLSLRLCRVSSQQPCGKVQLRTKEVLELSASGGTVVVSGLLFKGGNLGAKRAAPRTSAAEEPARKAARVQAPAAAAQAPAAAAKAPVKKTPEPAAKKAEAAPAAAKKPEAVAKPAAKAIVDPRVALKGKDDQAANAVLAGAKAAMEVAKAKAVEMGSSSAPQSGPKKVTLKNGLTYELLKPGRGPPVTHGRRVKVKYDGRLAKNGKRFDKGTISFKLGAGEVIQGWDQGVKGMLRGEQRRLLIPANMGYGSRGAPPDIPPNAALTFEVELLQF